MKQLNVEPPRRLKSRRYLFIYSCYEEGMQEAKMNFKGDEIPVWTPLDFIKQTALSKEAVTW